MEQTAAMYGGTRTTHTDTRRRITHLIEQLRAWLHIQLEWDGGLIHLLPLVFRNNRSFTFSL
uniref:Uncharacterized protein n=1 Tax=Picea glauca TaxID=3330 RepID=A0A124GMI0_PICGL|nr:hypothetical protein ABT39_MTgene2307 [Picea glauca]